MPTRKSALPVDEILPAVTKSLKEQPNLVIEAPPGAGKTTRVPPALLDVAPGEVVVLEPRRIAARLAARRVAWEMGEELGNTVGYQVRFEEVASKNTRLRFVTEGILTRRFLSDPNLKNVSAVVLDEFHERHLESDLALALLKRLQRTRPELLIVVMSATLETDPVARYLGNCPILRSEGKLFGLDVQHLPYSPEPLEMQVRKAAELLIRDWPTGDILTFLPGAAEIRRAMRECNAVAQRAGVIVLPLHGDLLPQEQDRAITGSKERKLILSTNVAESSVTIEGVAAVIDSGLARFATYSPWSGLPTLHVGRVSKASAQQRAGRAGRTGPGRVIRLFPEEDYLRRPQHEVPEIVRADLSHMLLDLRAMGIQSVSELDWLDTPPPAAIENAEALLDRLGASGEMSEQLARFPLPPRISRILIEAIRRGVGEHGCVASAVLGSGVKSSQSDVLAATESEHDRRLQQHIEQLRRIARPPRQTKRSDEDLLMSVLAGFPDRVARLRSGNQVLLSNGSSAEIAGEKPTYQFMVAVDAEDRKDKALPIIRMTSRIEPEWLIDMFPDRVRDEAGVEWNHSAERVETVSRLMYDDLIIEESRGHKVNPEAAAELLAQKAMESGLDRLIDLNAFEEFRARMTFAGLQLPDLRTTIREISIGLRSFSELRNASAQLIPLLESKIGSRKLMDLAPLSVRLQNGRQTKIHYSHDKAPWIASRLQDFFGMREGPRIGPGKTPVVIHLLAPNQRPVQTTTDLAGFWERLYPQVRKELMRRYPKHKWPESPF